MNEIMVKADHVTVRFNLASQKVDNLKEYVVQLLKRQLLFQEFFALWDVSFEVKKGESWGFIGTNGAGKSTLLKVISGIMKPYQGRITVNGTISPMIELGAGFNEELTARENIILNGCVLGYSEKFMLEHFDQIVDFAEVGPFLDSPLKNFSSGMRARLGFSVATMVKPDILIVDEVLSVGDIRFRQKCMKRMEELMSGGTTVLYVSHNMGEIEKLCDHVLWLDHGKTVMTGETKQVCDAYYEKNLGKNREGK